MDTFKAKYVGEADEVEAFGLEFKRGKAVDVPLKYAAKIEGNPYFDTSDKKAEKTAEKQNEASQKRADEREEKGGGEIAAVSSTATGGKS